MSNRHDSQFYEKKKTKHGNINQNIKFLSYKNLNKYCLDK